MTNSMLLKRLDILFYIHFEVSIDISMALTVERFGKHAIYVFIIV